MWRNSSSVTEHLSTDIFTNRRCSIQLQKHIRFQSILGPIHLEISDVIAKSHPLSLNVKDHILQLVLLSHEINAPKPGVLVAGVEGLEIHFVYYFLVFCRAASWPICFDLPCRVMTHLFWFAVPRHDPFVLICRAVSCSERPNIWFGSVNSAKWLLR